MSLILPAAASPAAAEGQGETAFVAVADSYVEQTKPDRNYGRRNELRVDGSPLLNGYLRFSVEGVSDFSSARLRLFVRSGSSTGFDVRPVSDNGWDESTITWNNAPAFGAVAASSGPAPAGTWVDIDVSSLVTQNGPVSFALTTTAVTAIALRSRESAETPQLLVGTAPPPPNQSPTASFTYSCTGLTCTFDGSASSDPDGTIVSHDWAFGGDGTGSGATTSHTFSADGSYAVTLTVADDDGAPSSTTQTVTVSESSSGTTYVVSRTGSTYQAVSSSHTFSGSLKSVVESAVSQLGSGGGTIQFEAGDFDLGTDHFEFYDITDITFQGAGMGATVIRNFTSVASDTEPFDIVGGVDLAVRDLTVSAGGALRSTSDALDFDNGRGILIERVEVTGSRSRGIIFDGKGDGWEAEGNVVRDCRITGIPGKGIELLASSANLIEGCIITDVGGHGIQVNKSSSSASQPNKKSNDNIIRNNTITRAGEHGIYINSSDRNSLAGNTITNSGQLASSRDGIRISSSNSITCDDNVVDGNVATDTQATKTQTYGMRIASSLCNRTVVGAANNFEGNKVGAIRDDGTDTIYPPPPGDTDAPSTPTGLQAVAASGCRIDLSWNASTDNVGVTEYGIYRDGALLASVAGSALSYADTAVSPGSTQTYRVDAADASGNRSALSDPASATTASTACATTLLPVADSWVDESQPTANNGTKTTLRVDGSPTLVSYLKFDVQVGGTITSAKLQIFVNSNHSVGYDVRPVADTSWTETGITYATAPSYGAVIGSSGAFAAGSWIEIDVTSIITANGLRSIALTTTSSTAMSLASRESGSNAPQLIIETE